MVSPPRAYAFPLATFHVCVLVLVFVALAYPYMGGVDELNTALGLKGRITREALVASAKKLADETAG